MELDRQKNATIYKKWHPLDEIEVDPFHEIRLAPIDEIEVVPFDEIRQVVPLCGTKPVKVCGIRHQYLNV